ncbi:hypothetical protein [Deinococcus sp.]|uniref:hypothetical protein n=1 Tax=Deinococcus sp. TaxID=47478 RepID=UPI003CC5B6E3
MHNKFRIGPRPLLLTRRRPALLALVLSIAAIPGVALARADPFANAWTRQASGRIPVVDRNNVVTYTIKHGQTTPDLVRFVLVLGAGTDAGNNIYRKSLFIVSGYPHLLTNFEGAMTSDPSTFFDASYRREGDSWYRLGEMVYPDYTRRSSQIPILKSELNAYVSLELHKDNFMGGFSTAAVLHDLEYLQGGDVVTITWEREQN